MGDLSNAMQNLVDDIKSSAEIRHAAVKELMDETGNFMSDVRIKVSEVKSDTHNLLERFCIEHQDIAAALKEKLPSDEAARSEATQQFMSGVREEVEADSKATQNLIKQFHSEHQDMANALKEKLSSDEASRREAAQQFMGDVRADDATRRGVMSDVESEVEADREATQNLLKQFHSEHQDMANALKEKLSSDEAARSEATQQFMGSVREEVKADSDATQQFIDELTSDRREAQNIWRGRSGGRVEEIAPEPVAEEEPVEEAASEPVAEEEVVEETAPEPVAQEEEVVEVTEPEPIVEEEAALSPEDQILAVVAEHPEGIRLVDIGNELGVDWRGLIGAVKTIVDADRVEKIDNLYYPKS